MIRTVDQAEAERRKDNRQRQSAGGQGGRSTVANLKAFVSRGRS